MAERAWAMIAALALAGCGDAGGGEDGSAASTGAPIDMTGGTGDPPATSDGPTTGVDVTGGETGAADTTGAPDPTSGEGGTSGATDEPAGVFVAVGDGGRRVRSSDGEAWDGVVGSGLLDTEEESAAPDALRALAVGDGYVIAVGGGGTYWAGNAMIMRSVDAGASWQEDILAGSPDVAQTKLHGVAASGQTVVAAGMRGKRIRSGDGGLTWTDVSFEDQNARLLAVAAIDATFVIVGWTEDSYEAPKTSAIFSSPDGGLTWGPVDETRPRLDAVVAGGGVFVALGAEVCLRGVDGVTWEDCKVGAAEYIGVSYTGGEFVLTTGEGLATSLDGLAWTVPVMPGFGAPKLLARGDGRWAGIRWTDRGFAEALDAWTYTSHATEPLRAIVFVPAIPP